MLLPFTLVVMAIVAWASFREGISTSVCTLLNVVLAGLVAFNFWEPIANLLDPALGGYEDIIVLIALFSLTLVVLRVATNNLANAQVQFPPQIQGIGGGVIGLFTGYLASGFLVCALQTLPWDERFLGFDPRSPSEETLRRVLPPDRIWLALMRHAGAVPFTFRTRNPNEDSPYDRYITFDGDGTFELRYLRYRRYSDTRRAILYQGEMEVELDKAPP